MDFSSTSFGKMPDEDEIEISVMGPGFGESIVVHYGSGNWLVVDSCRLSVDKSPAPIAYLERLGVNVRCSVKMIVATHWDKDHIQGIGSVIAACESAEFVCAKSFHHREFQEYIDELAIGSQDRGGGDIREAFEILKAAGRRILGASPGRTLLTSSGSPLTGLGAFQLYSLSPSDEEFDLFVREIASLRPKKGQPLLAAFHRTPNLSSVVLALKWNNASVLLGADMETHPHADRGWNSVVSEHRRSVLPKSVVVKIPHHGSISGHDDAMWKEMLDPLPISIIAPFGKGNVNTRPPTSRDLKRIRSLSSRLLITARHRSARPDARDQSVARGLRARGITTRAIRGNIGLVRLRKKSGQPWVHDLFGPAFESH